MIATADLHRTAREYLRAAKLLRTRKSYDAAVYLCGYAVEIALKARICKTLNWIDGFPETEKERPSGNILKIHKLDQLLQYTGIQARILSADATGHVADWSIVTKWNPEQRYSPRGTKTQSDADGMIESTQVLLRVLL